MYSKSTLAAAIAFAIHLSGAAATTCFKFGVGPVGTCVIDSRAVEKFQAYLNFDDSDSSCNNGGEIDINLVYTDENNIVRTATAINPAIVADAASTVDLLNFNVPLTNIATGVPATLLVTAYNSNADPYTTSVLWTQSEEPTISYVTSTASTTVYTTVGTTVTSAVTGKRFATTLPGYLHPTTSSTKTATKTVLPTSVSTITVVPNPLVQTKWVANTVTSTFSCDPQATGGAPHKLMAKRSFFDATNSAPFCGTPATTTIVNKVVTTTATSVVTTTATVLTSTFTISTSTAQSGTTHYAGATATTTTSLPAVTLTSYVKGSRVTQQVTSTSTRTIWAQPSKALGSGACKPALTYSLSATAAVHTTVVA